MLLAIDTSTRVMGVALYDGIQVLSEVVWNSRDYHTVELAPVVAETLQRSKVAVSDVQAVAVALGPGSFTGLRIGLALAKGMVLAGHLALVGIPTLDILAASQPVEKVTLAAVLRAGRGRLAVGRYNPDSGTWKPAGQTQVLTFEALVEGLDGPILVSGELSGEERKALSRLRKDVILASPAQSQRHPSFLAELGWRRWQAGQVDDAATLAPIYLHYNEPIPG